MIIDTVIVVKDSFDCSTHSICSDYILSVLISLIWPLLSLFFSVSSLLVFFWNIFAFLFYNLCVFFCPFPVFLQTTLIFVSFVTKLLFKSRFLFSRARSYSESQWSLLRFDALCISLAKCRESSAWVRNLWMSQCISKH